MPTFKLIKSKDFKVKEVTHTAYVVGHKGRAINLSTLSFVDEEAKIEVSADKSTVSIDCKVTVVQRPYTNDIGETVMGLSLMPKFDLEVDTF